MHGSYWSVEGCGWEPCPGTPDALATPWSAHGLAVPALPRVSSAGDVLRLPSRQALLASAMPTPREPAAPVDVLQP